MLGTGATLILGHSQPAVPGQGWTEYRQRAGLGCGSSRGRGAAVTGDVFGVGEHKRLKAALSACYNPAISSAEIWQSVNTGSKTARRKKCTWDPLKVTFGRKKNKFKRKQMFRSGVSNALRLTEGVLRTLFLCVRELFVRSEPVVTRHAVAPAGWMSHLPAHGTFGSWELLVLPDGPSPAAPAFPEHSYGSPKFILHAAAIEGL